MHPSPISAVTEPSELWPDALPLGEAWWLLGTEEQKIQYRGAGHNIHFTEFLKETMRRDLFSKIQCGDLLSLGIQTSPRLGGGPELLPRFIFSEPDVDWENSIIRAFGRIYEGVRVLSPEQAKTIEAATVLSDPREIPSPDPPQTLLRGRPTVGHQLREVVRDLAKKGQLKGMSRKGQESLVRSRAREKYPDLFPTESQPSRTKILEALKAEGISRPDDRPKSPKNP